MNKLAITILGSLVFTAGMVHAEPDVFSIEVARVQLGLKCTMVKDNGGDTECTIELKARGKQTVEMKQNEKAKGYAGIDMVSDATGQYVYALIAKQDKSIAGVSMAYLKQNEEGTAFDAVASAVESSSFTAVNIPKLNIVIGDDESVTVDLSLVAYAPASGDNMVTTTNEKALVDYVLKKIQPAIDAARLK